MDWKPRQVLVWAALAGLCIPQAAFGVELPPGQPLAAGAVSAAIVDVAMVSPGTVLGQVLDSQGAMVPKTRVSFRSTTGEIASTMTDEQGQFTQAGLAQGGVYEVAAAEGRGLYRVWQPGTAPPAAQPRALIIARGRLVRGQSGTPFWSLTNPLLVGGLVGAAVAIPVAIHNANNNPASP